MFYVYHGTTLGRRHLTGFGWLHIEVISRDLTGLIQKIRLITSNISNRSKGRKSQRNEGTQNHVKVGRKQFLFYTLFRSPSVNGRRKLTNKSLSNYRSVSPTDPFFHFILFEVGELQVLLTLRRDFDIRHSFLLVWY